MIKKMLPLIAATMSFSLSIGIILVLIPVELESRDVSYSYIGLNGSIALAASLFVMPILPLIANRIGILSLVTILCLIRVICFLIIPHTSGYWDFVAIAWLIGPTGVGYYTTLLTWASEIAPKNKKGIGVAIITSFMTTGIAFGPLIAKGLIGSDFGFYIAAAIFVTGLIPFYFWRDNLPDLKERPEFSLWQILRNNPRPLLAQGICDFTFFAMASFIVLFGMDYGITPEKSALLLTAYMAGSVICSIPLGVLADNINKFAIVMISVFVLITTSAILPYFVTHIVYSWFVIALIGVCISAIYISAVSVINNRYTGNNRVAANSAIAFNGNIFAMAGTFFAGKAMDIWKPDGLVYSIITMAIIFVIFSAIRGFFKQNNQGW